MSTTINVSGTPISAKPNKKQTMYFDVIVSFSITQETVQALNRAIHEDCNMYIDGFQARFYLAINIYTSSTYESVMRRLKREIEQCVADEIGLDDSYLEKISTCAPWKQWEELTGKNFVQEVACSEVWQNGKFYY